jgi:hypothetical protein
MIKGLSDREFEVFKLELSMLAQRIAQLENLQYRLRQFSITLWALVMTVGMGLPRVGDRKAWIFALALLIPAIFLYLDAIYAVIAQSLRTRRDRLIERLNAKPQDARVAGGIPLMDLTGRSTDWDDPQASYRRSLLVKLTRTTRLFFYGLQLVGACAALGAWLVEFSDSTAALGYSVAPGMILFLVGLVMARRMLRWARRRSLPSAYPRELDNRADGTPVADLRRTPR